jgi:MFS family permease
MMVPLRVIGPFAFGYFLSYLYRVVNAVAGPAISADIGLDAGGLGLLTSVYFLAFAAFQLPLGVLLDRFGPRRVEGTLLLFAAAGALLFGLSESLGGLTVGRALIGLGVSACLMAAFKAYAVSVPGERLALVNGIHLAAGGLGALFGGLPSEAMLDAFGWRSLFWLLAGLTLLASLSLFLVVPRGTKGDAQGTLGEQIAAVRRIFASAPFWRLVPACVASQATALSLQSLWAGPWLREVADLPPSRTAAVLSLMAAALVAGFLVLGTLAERLDRRGVPTINVALVGMSAFVLVQIALIALPPDVARYAWFAHSFFGTAGVLCYAVLTRAYSGALAGRVNTALNFLVFTASFVMQWGVGEIVDAVPGEQGDGFDLAFALLASIQVVALAWLFLGRRVFTAAA